MSLELAKIKYINKVQAGAGDACHGPLEYFSVLGLLLEQGKEAVLVCQLLLTWERTPTAIWYTSHSPSYNSTESRVGRLERSNIL